MALEDTAILDILLPNYDNQMRFCNFYYELDEENEISAFPDGKGITTSPEETKEQSWLKDAKSIIKKEEKEFETAKMSDSKGPYIKVIYALPPSDMDIDILAYDGDSMA